MNGRGGVGGGVKLTLPPDKTTLKKSSLIRVKEMGFDKSLTLRDNNYNEVIELSKTLNINILLRILS